MYKFEAGIAQTGYDFIGTSVGLIDGRFTASSISETDRSIDITQHDIYYAPSPSSRWARVVSQPRGWHRMKEETHREWRAYKTKDGDCKERVRGSDTIIHG